MLSARNRKVDLSRWLHFATGQTTGLIKNVPPAGKNLDDEDIKKLSSYEKHGIESHRASRKRLIEEIEAEEDAEDEDEVQDVP